MKVGIITLNGYTNFGNRLQNYAVVHTLQSKFDCKAEALVPINKKPLYNVNMGQWLKELAIKTLCKFPLLSEKRYGADTIRWANFHNWNRKYVPTKFFYEKCSLTKELNSEYDMFFVGSDQVWNYRFPDVNYNDYFLLFADSQKRTAICASFGVESIPPELEQCYIDGLSGFNHISVREKVGATIIKDLIGREVPVLIDPVMFLSREEWLKVAKKPRVDISKPYILKYYLGNEADDNQIELWAKENGYAIYTMLDQNNSALYSAGPGEFISLIANASLVVSDSFHCIAFSTIFKKPFIVYTRSYMNARLDTLLELFGLQNRWGHLLTPDEYLNCNHEHTDEIMYTEQKRAYDFIKNSLKPN